MNLLVKGYYGYKNFGDELILLALLWWIDENFGSYQIFISAGDEKWLEKRIVNHKRYYPAGMLEKITVLPKSDKIQLAKEALGMGEDWDFVVLWGGQVVDEDRKFPHDGWNIPMLYRKYLNEWKVALIWGIGTENKDGTALLHKILLDRSKIILLRDKFSEGLAEKYLNEEKKEKKLQTVGDLSLPILENFKNQMIVSYEKSQRDPYVLINVSPEVDFDASVRKIKLFLSRFPQCQPVFFAAHAVDDMKYFSRLQELFPSLELFDWTQAGVEKTLNLFYFAEAGIWQRLHFLYILKFLGKEYEVLKMTHKIQVNLLDID